MHGTLDELARKIGQSEGLGRAAKACGFRVDGVRRSLGFLDDFAVPAVDIKVRIGDFGEPENSV